MAIETTNDNGSGGPGHGPDAHGHAAMLLVESLIHGLVARNLLTVADVVEIVEVATEVKTEISRDLGDSPANMRKSLDLLTAVSASLRFDLPGE